MSDGEVDHSGRAVNSALHVSYQWRTTQVSTLGFILVWYLFWLPACALATCGLIQDPGNLFLWFWMLFGVGGLILGPLSFLELFTRYAFLEDPTHYRVVLAHALRKPREIVVPKTDFVSLGFDDDEGHESDQVSLVFLKNERLIRRRLMTYITKAEKQRILSTLGWVGGSGRPSPASSDGNPTVPAPLP